MMVILCLCEECSHEFLVIFFCGVSVLIEKKLDLSLVCLPISWFDHAHGSMPIDPCPPCLLYASSGFMIAKVPVTSKDVHGSVGLKGR